MFLRKRHKILLLLQLLHVLNTYFCRELQMKCIQYWPDEGSLAFGKVVVSLKETEPFSDFVIRTFVVTKVHVKHVYTTLS